MYIVLKNKRIKIKDGKNFLYRLIGFMFRIEPIKTGLRLKCNSIHTFFMYQPIDVAMTDEKNKILYLYQSLKPWSIITPKEGVCYTYEFGNNMLNDYSINDTLKVKTTDK